MTAPPPVGSPQDQDGPRALELGGPDAILRLALARAEPITPLPAAPDVARLPGARLVAFTVLQAGDATVQIGCARASSERWVPGLEALVFERAMGLSLGPSGLRPERLTRTTPPPMEGVFAVERWSGATRGADGERALEALQLLAFVGADADAIACTVLCLRPGSPAGGSPDQRCAALLDATSLSGELRPPPAPGLFARALVGAAEHPVAAMAIAASLALAVVAGLLATRPRLRPSAFRGARARSR